MLILKDYQIKAVDNLEKTTKELLKMEQKKKLIVFKAPTGSGKTVIASKYIEKLSNSDEDICFMWISIGKGSLHEQSRNKINDILEGSPSCKLLEEVITDGIIKRNQVVVVNWESLNKKKQGEWDNVLMRDGEKTNFQQLVENTNKNRKIILLVDESHHGTDTKTSEELKNMINPEILINLSATPKYIPPQNKEDERYIEIKAKEVIEAGIIKKEVFINDIIEEADIEGESKDVLDIVVDASVKRREELKEAYKEIGANINPLCLIQIPNAKEGELILGELEDILKTKDISLEIGNLAIWTTDRSENLTGINQYDSKVDYLIFKMAIATGWDCPRAQILLKLREVKSEVFDIQTIGRVLRMPEQKHYENELLNRAYIYTNNSDIKVNVENLSMVKYIKAKIRQGIENIELKSYHKQENNNMLIKRELLDPLFYELLEKEIGLSLNNSPDKNIGLLKEAKYITDMEHVKSDIISHGVINSNSLDSEDKHITYDTVSFNLSEKDINKLFTEILAEKTPRLFNSVKPLWHIAFSDLLGLDRKGKGISTKLQTLFLNNRESFISIIIQLKEMYQSKYREEIIREVFEGYSTFSVPEPKIKDSEGIEIFPAKAHIYDKCILKTSRSLPERNFEEFLEKNGDKINWWYKNEDSGRENFGIRYEYEREPHAFYPDYIVSLKDGRIGLYETKSKDDRDAKTYTKAKAEYMQKYIKEENKNSKNLIGGIVNSSNKDNIVINNKEAFYPYLDKVEDWDILKF